MDKHKKTNKPKIVLGLDSPELICFIATTILEIEKRIIKKKIILPIESKIINIILKFFRFIYPKFYIHTITAITINNKFIVH